MAGPEPPARAGAFDPPYDHLATLPRGLWLPALVCSAGRAELLLVHAAAWRQALLDGTLPPPEAHFGCPEGSAALRQVVGELELPALARGVPAVAEQVLRTLLWHLDRIADLQHPATPEQALATTVADFRAAWQLQKVSLEPQLVLLRQWADTAQLRWDDLQGPLHRREWDAARRAADRLAALPELQALLQRLGRREPELRPRPAPHPQAAAPRRPLPLAPVRTQLPGAPGEITGIRLGRGVEQMLPAEALWLRHPLLQRLWRARLAEGRLLAHDTTAEVVDWRPSPHGRPQEPPPRLQPAALARGPVVLCLDTSGSMRGAPENVAKAVVIAALRLAREQGRAVRLVAFGGPGELLERDLLPPLGQPDADATALRAVLDLMGQSFDGGTDVQTPIERALASIRQAGWSGADLLIVSDGEFGCVRSTLERLDEARREQGLFVQGVLVGDRETLGMLEVCDAIHWVRDWRRHADAAAEPRGTGFSPVHSKSLTALYFPGALSPQAARHHARGAGSER